MNFKVGDTVICTEHYSSHEAHNIQKEINYVVTFVGNEVTAGINLNNPCPRNNPDYRCECHNSDRGYWAERCFKLVEIITSEDIKLAKPLPSVEDAAAFFGMRTP